MDTDQSGFIDYNEFVSASIDKEIVTQNEKLMEAFKMFDKDNNGAISP
jgi:Ca2+-binding EF-hand superfamily protein